MILKSGEGGRDREREIDRQIETDMHEKETWIGCLP